MFFTLQSHLFTSSHSVALFVFSTFFVQIDDTPSNIALLETTSHHDYGTSPHPILYFRCDGIPTSASRIPSSARRIPTSSARIPTSSTGIPSSAGWLPTASGCIPSSSTGISTSSGWRRRRPQQMCDDLPHLYLYGNELVMCKCEYLISFL